MSTTLNQEALRPCPFCGERPTVRRSNDGSMVVRCGCSAEGPLAHNSEAAIAAWNTRAASPANELVEALREVREFVEFERQTRGIADGTYEPEHQASPLIDRIDTALAKAGAA